MALTDIRIISGGVTNYLINSSGSPTIGGAATAAATTPFALLREDWVMMPAEPIPAMQGGPPFRNGSDLAYQAYGNTTQMIGFSVQGSSHDNTVALLRSLRNLLNQTLMATPAALYYQPSTATNAMYFEIVNGGIHERPGPFNPAMGIAYLEFDLVLILKPFGGRVSTGEALATAAGFLNTGSGGTNDVISLSTGSGDMVNEGQPMNIRLTTTVGGFTTLLFASILSRAYSTTSAASAAISTTTFTSLGLPTTTSAAALYTGKGLKVRVLLRFSAMSANAEVRLAFAQAANNTVPTVPVRPGGTVAILVDMGKLALASRDRASYSTAENLSIQPQVRSTNGAAIAVTLEYMEVLFYYDFCKGTYGSGTSAGTGNYAVVDSFVERSGYPALPHSPIQTYVLDNATNAPSYWGYLIGSAPRYFSGCSLWAAMIETGFAHSKAYAATITVTQAPLWFTLRGAQ